MTLSESDCVTLIEGLTVRRLRTWVREGWVRPRREARGLAFDEIDVARLRLIVHLRQELRLNEEAVPVVLALLDQVYGLRRELRGLARAVEAQPDDVADRILARLREAEDIFPD